MIRYLLLTASAVALTGCGNGDVEERLTALEHRLAALEARGVNPAAVQAGSADAEVRTDSKADSNAMTAQAIDDLDSALGRMEMARDNQDRALGQGAMAALNEALDVLRQDPAAALPALLARAEAAGSVRQAGLMECYAKVGGAAAAPTLFDVATDPNRTAGLRVQAARGLIAVDPLAAVPAVESLLALPEQLPEMYLLVHLLANSGRSEALPVLVAALRDSGDRSVRCHAATGLGHFAGPTAAEALTAAATTDEYPAVRTNALRALARVVDRARLQTVVAEVVENDDDPAVRDTARGLQPSTGR